jgi:hypothetical protein
MMTTLSGAVDALVKEGITEHFGLRGSPLRALESDMSIVYSIRESQRHRLAVYSNPVISTLVDSVAVRCREARKEEIR